MRVCVRTAVAEAQRERGLTPGPVGRLSVHRSRGGGSSGAKRMRVWSRPEAEQSGGKQGRGHTLGADGAGVQVRGWSAGKRRRRVAHGR